MEYRNLCDDVSSFVYIYGGVKVEITKEDFIRFEHVRESGQCNMMDINRVMLLSDLSTDKIKHIIKHYDKIKEEIEDEEISYL